MFKMYFICNKYNINTFSFLNENMYVKNHYLCKY